MDDGPAEHSDPRLAPLLDAVLAIARDVDLDGVLDRVVRASREMIGADYAALGVLDETGAAMARFLHTGIDPETADRIGPLPTGRGVLGEVIRHPEPLVLEDLGEHPSSVGFPPHHPPMTTFLGVPVVVGDDVFGNLYLTDKEGGFTAEDRELVVGLAAVAGAAIRNARDVDRLTSQARVDAAVADVATTVLGGATTEEGLDATRRAAASLADVSPSLVTLREDDSGPAGEVVHDSEGVHLRVAADGHALVLPAEAEPASEELRAFGRRVAIALGYARARDQVEHLAVRLDRERIARDLHDTVIQRLFGAGLQLDGLGRLLKEEANTDIVESVIGELDAAIGDLRRTIATMHDPGPLPLADRLHAVVAALRPITAGLRRLDTTGDPSRVPAAIADDLVAVLREGITNATRHAGASQIIPRLEVDDGQVVLSVVDDGIGPPTSDEVAEAGRGLGLGNLAARAQRHDGGCELTGTPDDVAASGAQLRWWAPLPAD